MPTTEIPQPLPLRVFSNVPLYEQDAYITRVELPERTSVDIEPNGIPPRHLTAFVLASFGIVNAECARLTETTPSSAGSYICEAIFKIGGQTLSNAVMMSFDTPKVFYPQNPLPPFNLSEEQLEHSAYLALGRTQAQIATIYGKHVDTLRRRLLAPAVAATGTYDVAGHTMMTTLSGQLQPYLPLVQEQLKNKTGPSFFRHLRKGPQKRTA